MMPDCSGTLRTSPGSFRLVFSARAQSHSRPVNETFVDCSAYLMMSPVVGDLPVSVGGGSWD
jgi:hypothetical protein